MEMSESVDTRIEIPSNQPVNNHDIVIKEWESCLRGNERTKDYQRKRLIQKLPPLLLQGEKGVINREFYEPVLVSFGPYHHNRATFEQAERYKLVTLEEYSLCTVKTINSLYDKVFEVVDECRACYIDGSTDDYDDEDFNRMMLHDGCFILFFIECLAYGNKEVLLNNEYLGALGFANIIRDMFLLENQIPYVVLDVLLDLRFPDDKGEIILNKFFNYLNYGEMILWDDKKVLKNERPLHLLELYRSYFISFKASLGPSSTNSSRWPIEDYNNVKPNQWFGSVMDLHAKGVFVKCNYMEPSGNESIKFIPYCSSGELVLVRRAVTSYTKAIYVNMIAYELCPHNPNDFKVSTYVTIMKTLLVRPDDVKELRNENIMIHSLGRDELVVKMFGDIEAPAINRYMFNQLRRGINKHCNNKNKTGAAEVIDVYFSSPWKTIASLAATSVLVLTFLQTYFTIIPLLRNSHK